MEQNKNEPNKNEQNKNEQHKNEQVKPIKPDSNKPKTKEELKKEKRLYLYTAISCAVALVAIVIIAIATTGDAKIDNQTNNSVSQSSVDSSVDDGAQDPTPEKPVVTVPEGMIAPIEAVSVGNDYGFYYNQTLNIYHEHDGLDFTAAAGTNVLAVEDGVVESIYKDDLLLGTEIVVRHEDGLKSVYRFVTEADGLKVGDAVKKGDLIATVAEASGGEYKEGAHLHFEILKNGENIDPTEYLTLEEK